MPKIKRPPQFGFKYDHILTPLLIIVSVLIFIVLMFLFVIEKSDKVKEEFNQPIRVVSNCTIDYNNSKDDAIILNCNFAN